LKNFFAFARKYTDSVDGLADKVTVQAVIDCNDIEVFQIFVDLVHACVEDMSMCGNPLPSCVKLSGD
jgi:hypothetical protein